MKVNLNGEYGTWGNPTVAVRIYATDGGGEWPIHGAYFVPDEGQWRSTTWLADGCCTREGPAQSADLVPLGEPKQTGTSTKWVNVYKDGNIGDLRRSRASANRWPTDRHRIACVKVEINWTEGQFDA